MRVLIYKREDGMNFWSSDQPPHQLRGVHLSPPRWINKMSLESSPSFAYEFTDLGCLRALKNLSWSLVWRTTSRL